MPLGRDRLMFWIIWLLRGEGSFNRLRRLFINRYAHVAIGQILGVRLMRIGAKASSSPGGRVTGRGSAYKVPADFSLVLYRPSGREIIGLVQRDS